MRERGGRERRGRGAGEGDAGARRLCVACVSLVCRLCVACASLVCRLGGGGGVVCLRPCLYIYVYERSWCLLVFGLQAFICVCVRWLRLEDFTPPHTSSHLLTPPHTSSHARARTPVHPYHAPPFTHTMHHRSPILTSTRATSPALVLFFPPDGGRGDRRGRGRRDG